MRQSKQSLITLEYNKLLAYIHFLIINDSQIKSFITLAVLRRSV